MPAARRSYLSRFLILVAAPIAILLVLCSATPVGAALLYQLQDIGTGTFSSAVAINNNDEVVVNYSTSQTATSAIGAAFIYANGTTTLLTPNGTGLHAAAINDNNQAVGYYRVNGVQHAFVYSNNVITDLGTLDDTAVYPTAINNSGQIVGIDQGSGGAGGPAFYYSGGTKTNLPSSPIRTAVINNSGEVASNSGSGSLLFSGTMETSLLPTISALAINDSGQIAGYNNLGHAALYSDGSTIDLGTLGGSTSEGLAMNSTGDVVGYSVTDTIAFHAFLYAGSGPMQDINSLIDAPGWTVTFAYGINDAGDIVGQAIDPNGQTDAVLLTPVVPEPATLSLLALPIAAVLLCRRQKSSACIPLEKTPRRDR